MKSHNFFRRTLATVSALALILNLVPSFVPTPKAHAADGDWTEEYWNVEEGGPYAFPETPADYEGIIPDGGLPNYYTGDESPYPGDVNANYFVARYTATINFDSANYTFRTYTDDGVRLYIDGEEVIGDWNYMGGAVHLYDTYLSGEHEVVMEYFEGGGNASIHLDYHKTSEFGEGSSSNPYRIHDCYELQTIAADLTVDYKLVEDIDCSITNDWGADSGTKRGFYPLGNTSSRFSGDFDGNGQTISDLHILRPGIDWVGLFGVIDEGGTVHDFDLENVDITGRHDTGALAGGLSGTVTNVTSSGEVDGQEYVGGLVGYHTEPGGIGSSSPLVFTWNGSGYKYIADVGRILGRYITGNDPTPVRNADLVPKDGEYSVKISEEYNEVVYYDEVALTTVDHAPGYEAATSLLRSAPDQYYTIASTPSNPLQACTDAFGNDCVNDLENFDNSWSYKDDSNINEWTMNFGDLSGAARKQLVFAGARDFSIKNGTTIRYIKVKNAQGDWVNAYTNAQISSLRGAPVTHVIDMTNKFLTDDYTIKVGMDRTRFNYFAMDTSAPVAYTANTIHPSLVNLGFHGYSAVDRTYFWDHDYNMISPNPPEVFATQNGNFTKYGDVTPLLAAADDQFVIIHHGDQMDIHFDYTPPADGLERSFILQNNAMFKHANTGPTGRTVDPIPFNGMTKYPYDSNESYPMTSENIDYLNTWNTRVINDPTAPHSSTIIDSSSSADVYGTYYVGGLVGYNNTDKLITGSSATGDVYADYNVVGGLVGENYLGTITHSYATGNVFGDTGTSIDIGGLVGVNYGEINASYALGDVEGYERVGGLSGYESGLITDAYARGDVYASSDYAGGLIGLAYSTSYRTYATGEVTGEGSLGGLAADGESADIQDSFWDIDTTGVEDNYGGGEGLNTEDMMLRATYTDVGWDFDTIWEMSELVNDGYPTFQMAVVDTGSHSRAKRLSQVYGDGWDDPEDGDIPADDSGDDTTSEDTGSSGNGSGDDSENTTPEDPGPIGEDHGPIPEYDSYTGHNEAPESDRTGISPWDATTEPISDIAKGWYIRGENFDTVYFVAEDGTRRPFWDAKTFRTWANWSDVIWVTDATLATTKVGKPMTPKPGVVLVKIQGEPETYAISEDQGHYPILRKIPSEAVAIAVYGRNWADYVLDIPPTMLTLLGSGDPVSSDDHPDLSVMMTREQLAK